MQDYEVMTARFDDHTLAANYKVRMENGYACLYCVPHLIVTVPLNTILFVIEMNVEKTNQRVEGIGLIRNNRDPERRLVHSNPEYNRYNYVGRQFIRRDEIEHYAPKLLAVLDYYLFNGKAHCKRGQDLTRFPPTLSNRIVDNENITVSLEIRELFLKWAAQNGDNVMRPGYISQGGRTPKELRTMIQGYVLKKDQAGSRKRRRTAVVLDTADADPTADPSAELHSSSSDEEEELEQEYRVPPPPSSSSFREASMPTNE